MSSFLTEREGKVFYDNSLEIQLKKWRNYDDMADQRKYWNELLGYTSEKSEWLNRRVEVKLISAGKCKM